MRWWSFDNSPQWNCGAKDEGNMKKTIIMMMLAAVVLAGCEKDIVRDEVADLDGNVTLRFAMTNRDAKTRGTAADAAGTVATGAVTRAGMGDFFHKLNVMVFSEDGERMLDKVATQTRDDDDFGVLHLSLADGRYWVVAVGHSSKRSATIKSPEVVQFTASEGEKLTDTFCACELITVDGGTFDHTLTMFRAVAMVQFTLQDDDVPVNFSHFKMEYTGGSANFNPQTLEGITKSTQSETRTTNGVQVYQAFTFPYMSEAGTLKMTCTALDLDGNVIRKRVFEGVQVTRNRITTYSGPFFEDGDGEWSQTDFSFVIHADWDGEDFYNF